MTIEYFKKAEKTAATGEQEVRATVQEILDAIEAGGEAKAREFAANLDKWDGDIVVSPDALKHAADKVPEQLKDDIRPIQ